MTEAERLFAAATFERMRIMREPAPTNRPRPAAPGCSGVYEIPERHNERPILFRCSRRFNHNGGHIARGFAGRIVKRWSS